MVAVGKLGQYLYSYGKRTASSYVYVYVGSYVYVYVGSYGKNQTVMQKLPSSNFLYV